MDCSSGNALDEGQAIIVVVVTSALGVLRAHRPQLARRIVTVASSFVVAAGLFWFFQRV